MKPFKKIKGINDVAESVLKRYYHTGEFTWEQVVDRVVDCVLEEDGEDKEYTRDMIKHLYFIPNSPCLVNAGTKNGGLLACFVVDFSDSIDEIFKTKLDFALIAKKGGGCGTTLTKLRPKNSLVSGSVHGHAGGPINFYNTICHDMEVMTQAGFRHMAQMGTMSIYHPDILRFLFAKYQEGKMTTTNLSITVDDKFMELVANDPDEFHTVKHKKWGEGYLIKGLNEDAPHKYYPVTREELKEYNYDLGDEDDFLTVSQLFKLITDMAWRNGEPGLLFYNRINDSPYKYTGQEILATNPCGEQPLPPNGSCNLGSLDISKFLDESDRLDLGTLELAVRLAVRFLDRVIDVNSFPTEEIKQWALNNRPVGLGIMGFADYLLTQKVAYGSEVSTELLEFILNFIHKIAEDESIKLGLELGIPEECKKLPVPRRNITLLTVAPTGSISLIAGCSSSIEPIFSELTLRQDTTGTYNIENDLIDEDYFRCAVSTNGGKEVSWQEHLAILNSAQRFVDSGVSKTINCPKGTKKETVYRIFLDAWKSVYIKGITIYRNGSREVEVLSPKNIKKNLCPYCESEMEKKEGCTKCTNPDCQYSLCDL